MAEPPQSDTEHLALPAGTMEKGTPSPSSPPAATSGSHSSSCPEPLLGLLLTQAKPATSSFLPPESCGLKVLPQVSKGMNGGLWSLGMDRPSRTVQEERPWRKSLTVLSSP